MIYVGFCFLKTGSGFSIFMGYVGFCLQICYIDLQNCIIFGTNLCNHAKKSRGKSKIELYIYEKLV